MKESVLDLMDGEGNEGRNKQERRRMEQVTQTEKRAKVRKSFWQWKQNPTPWRGMAAGKTPREE